jgi:hypothetical protein
MVLCKQGDKLMRNFLKINDEHLKSPVLIDENLTVQMEKDSLIDDAPDHAFNKDMLGALLGMTARELTAMYLTTTQPELFGEYTDTHMGRIFVVDDEQMEVITHPSTCLQHPIGGKSFQNTFSIHDTVSKKTIVIDLNNEAKTFKEISARYIEDTMIIEASDETEDVSVIIFGDNMCTETALHLLYDFCKYKEMSEYRVLQFLNSRQYPMDKSRLKIIVDWNHNAEDIKMVKKEDSDDIKWRNVLNVVKVTKNMINIAGSKQAGLHVLFDDDFPQFFPQGSLLKSGKKGMCFSSNFTLLTHEEIGEHIILNEKQKMALGPLPF